MGLTKGLIGVVYAFAAPEMNGENNVVIAHELLHTLGATDKYRPADDAPRFPDGYGDPQQVPLYPQRTAELMAGRRMLSAGSLAAGGEPRRSGHRPRHGLEIRWPQHSRAQHTEPQLSAAEHAGHASVHWWPARLWIAA